MRAREGDAGFAAGSPQSVITQQRDDRSSDRFGRVANRRQRIQAGQTLCADRGGDQRQALAQCFDHLPFHPGPLPQRDDRHACHGIPLAQFGIADVGHDRHAEMGEVSHPLGGMRSDDDQPCQRRLKVHQGHDVARQPACRVFIRRMGETGNEQQHLAPHRTARLREVREAVGLHRARNDNGLQIGDAIGFRLRRIEHDIGGTPDAPLAPQHAFRSAGDGAGDSGVPGRDRLLAQAGMMQVMSVNGDAGAAVAPQQRQILFRHVRAT
jgi:hypothetical protein